MSSNSDEFISVKEAALMSSYTPAYITRLIKKGAIKAKRQGRQWLVRTESIREYMDWAEKRKLERRDKIRADRLTNLRGAEYSATRLLHAANTSPFNAQALLQSLAVAGISLLVGALLQGVMEFQLSPEGLYDGAKIVVNTFSEHSWPITSNVSNLAAVAGADIGGWGDYWNKIWPQ